MEERLKRRKLDALKRGIHRVTGEDPLPLATHLVGVGKAGADAIKRILQDLEPGTPKLRALAIDIGDRDLAELHALAKTIPPERAEVTTIALDMPPAVAMFDVLAGYDTFLRLEYPNYRWPGNPLPWLPRSAYVPDTRQHHERAVAKAIYGYAYYSGARPLDHALRAFAASIDAERAQALVAVIFGMTGGTGSGIVVDLARHLSNGLFGRRTLVAGIGVAPNDGDRQISGRQTGGRLFSVLSELDVLCDENKNRNVVMSCGEMFRNPFTAGFIVIPQQHVWQATQDLAETHRRVDTAIAALMTSGRGTHVWELLRLLNWVAAPSTQHSAARTPWGPQWIHMLGFTDAADPALRASLGVLPSFHPEFIEIRVNDVDANHAAIVDSIQSAFEPDVPPHVVDGGKSGSAQFILPRLAKTDLATFAKSREAYAMADEEQRLLDHSLLLEQGIELCEPSTQLEGMAGASLAGASGWVAVPFEDIHGSPVVSAPLSMSV
ncbi:hypothetical protein [Rhodopila sp.]|uniref:hypothetical protein n=1 Tax=Rhodopila sp. TaxID=2480087 RepID=UPI003D0E0AF8